MSSRVASSVATPTRRSSPSATISAPRSKPSGSSMRTVACRVRQRTTHGPRGVLRAACRFASCAAMIAGWSTAIQSSGRVSLPSVRAEGACRGCAPIIPRDRSCPPLRTQAKELRRAMGRGGSVLEVGSYVGAFLAAARDEGCSRGARYQCGRQPLHAVDGIRGARRRVDDVNHGRRLRRRGDLEHVRSARRPSRRSECRARTAAFRRHLCRARAEWRVLWSTASRLPAAAGCDRRRARALFAQNNLLTFPYRWGFTERSLRRLFGESGFDVVRIAETCWCRSPTNGRADGRVGRRLGRRLW